MLTAANLAIRSRAELRSRSASDRQDLGPGPTSSSPCPPVPSPPNAVPLPFPCPLPLPLPPLLVGISVRVAVRLRRRGTVLELLKHFRDDLSSAFWSSLLHDRGPEHRLGKVCGRQNERAPASSTREPAVGVCGPTSTFSVPPSGEPLLPPAGRPSPPPSRKTSSPAAGLVVVPPPASSARPASTTPPRARRCTSIDAASQDVARAHFQRVAFPERLVRRAGFRVALRRRNGHGSPADRQLDSAPKFGRRGNRAVS